MVSFGCKDPLELMSTDGVRLLHRGVPQPLDSRKVAAMLVIVMLLPIFSPVTADESVAVSYTHLRAHET